MVSQLRRAPQYIVFMDMIDALHIYLFIFISLTTKGIVYFIMLRHLVIVMASHQIFSGHLSAFDQPTNQI